MVRTGVSAAVAIATCGTVAVATGCGGSSSAAPCKPGPTVTGASAADAQRHLSVVGRAAAKTEHAGTSRFAMRTGGEGASIDITGVTDLRKRRGLMQLSVNAAGTTLGGQIRLVGHCEYFAASALGLSTKKAWASVDLDQIAPTFGGTNGSAPSDSLEELKIFGTFRRVGTDDVRGVSTTHYRGRIDYEKASQDLPRRIKQSLEKLGARKVSTDAWIDGAGYLRRMTSTVGGVPVTIEYYDFGVPVNVSAPAPDTVEDITGKFKTVLGG